MSDFFNFCVSSIISNLLKSVNNHVHNLFINCLQFIQDLFLSLCYYNGVERQQLLILKDEREKVNDMRLNDLIIKWSNIRLEDNIIIHTLIKDNATDEIEKNRK